MHLTPREIDKLLLHNAGFLAQKRLARGVKLNLPEATALVATQLLEFIRDGRTVAELMELGRHFLGLRQVMPGVADMLHEVQVEGTFPDGSKLVTVHHPICAADGDLTLALYGSFLPTPDISLFGSSAALPTDDQAAEPRTDGPPGAIIADGPDITLNAHRDAVGIAVTNTGDRPIQVGSHYHFIETNAALVFPRATAYGRRLDIPAGTAVRFEPGETKTVRLVEIAGNRVIRGGNNLASGPVNEAGRLAAVQRVAQQRFGDAPAPAPAAPQL